MSVDTQIPSRSWRGAIVGSPCNGSSLSKLASARMNYLSGLRTHMNNGQDAPEVTEIEPSGRPQPLTNRASFPVARAGHLCLEDYLKVVS